jgi:hypothetical protein
MEYRSIRFAALMSTFMAGVLILGAVALTFGPWAQPSAKSSRALLMIGSFAFLMVSMVAMNVGAILERQADQIDALRRELADQRSNA